MRWILLILGTISLLAVAVTVIGALLPKAHSVSRTARINLPPDALYSVLSDVGEYRSWRPELTSLQRLPDKNGMPSWIEETNGMKIPMRFERMERPSLLVGRIDTDDLAFGGTWTYRIVAVGAAASDLTITEDGEVKNPIFRFMSRFVFGQYATMDGFLKHLKTKVA